MIKTKKLNSDRKLQALLEYCLLNGSNYPSGVPKTKLFKLIYLIDFASYYYFEKSITGKDYKNRKYGPVPDALFDLVDDMKKRGEIEVKDGKRAQFHSLVSESTFEKILSKRDIELARKVCKYWRTKKTGKIKDFVHKQRPWYLTKRGEVVPNQLILQEDSVYRPS